MSQTQIIDQIENFEREISLLEKNQLAVLLHLLINPASDEIKNFSEVKTLAKKINAELSEFSKKMIIGGICEKIKNL
jgi:hypothetical protein